MSERMRIDAARNYVDVLDAARRVVLRAGGDVALEQVAAEAGVGIATVYRRFRDRGALWTAVTLAALEEAERAARAAAASHRADGLSAVEDYLRSMLRSRAAAVVPELGARADVDQEALAGARQRSADAVAELVRLAHADGSLSPRISVGDVGVLLVRLSRPLPGELPGDVEQDLQRRHLSIVVAGLRHSADLDLPGPSFDDLGESAAWPAVPQPDRSSR